MNERTKELAIKSGIAYLSEHTAYFTKNDGLTVLPSVDSLEKFAESIVRQCGFELVDESLQYNSPLIQEFTVKVANRLKARFGLYDEQGGQAGWAK